MMRATEDDMEKACQKTDRTKKCYQQNEVAQRCS